MGNFFFAKEEHTLAKEYDGYLDTATIIGDNARGGDVYGGQECRIPSGGGGKHPQPKFLIAGPGFRVAPRPQPPTADEGTVGDVVWVDDANAALYIKTSQGWKRARLEA